MKRVAIVGVEGSGKTVMLAGLGDLYTYPDGDGYFLAPKNFGTAVYVAEKIEHMRKGEWPMATAGDEIQGLDWTLKHGNTEENRPPDSVCEVSFLDFAGEVYRAAYGISSDDNAALEDQVEALKRYVHGADDLIVLINLRDVITNGLRDKRVQEAMWITKSILDTALGDRVGKDVPRAAIVLSQADSYAETIKACGGALGVLEKYLPHVAAEYGWLDIFAANAVDKTVLDDDGTMVPAADFTTQGLLPILKWIRGEEVSDEAHGTTVLQDGTRESHSASTAEPSPVTEVASAEERMPPSEETASTQKHQSEAILLRCPGCGQELEAPPDAIGQKAECPLCGQKIIVQKDSSRMHKKVQLWEGGPYWAETNVGAENPWESGYYFWWGDTVGYKFENGVWVANGGSSPGFSFDEENIPTYGMDNSTLQREGWITAGGVLMPNHDAAHVKWGGDWRMPTDQELNDLCNKCDWNWTQLSGVNGCLVRGRGKYASASIFLSGAGYGYGSSRSFTSSVGYYLSSVPCLNGSWDLYFYSIHRGTNYGDRRCGRSIRPVQGFTK